MTESSAITRKQPFLFAAKKGKNYAWCACGKSKKQPLCDGSHGPDDKRPVIFSSDSDKKLVLCGCKHTHTPPYCDGTHMTL